MMDASTENNDVQAISEHVNTADENISFVSGTTIENTPRETTIPALPIAGNDERREEQELARSALSSMPPSSLPLYETNDVELPVLTPRKRVTEGRTEIPDSEAASEISSPVKRVEGVVGGEQAAELDGGVNEDDGSLAATTGRETTSGNDGGNGVEVPQIVVSEEEKSANKAVEGVENDEGAAISTNERNLESPTTPTSAEVPESSVEKPQNGAGVTTFADQVAATPIMDSLAPGNPESDPENPNPGEVAAGPTDAATTTISTTSNAPKSKVEIADSDGDSMTSLSTKSGLGEIATESRIPGENLKGNFGTVEPMCAATNTRVGRGQGVSALTTINDSAHASTRAENIEAAAPTKIVLPENQNRHLEQLSNSTEVTRHSHVENDSSTPMQIDQLETRKQPGWRAKETKSTKMSKMPEADTTTDLANPHPKDEIPTAGKTSKDVPMSDADTPVASISSTASLEPLQKGNATKKLNKKPSIGTSTTPTRASPKRRLSETDTPEEVESLGAKNSSLSSAIPTQPNLPEYNTQSEADLPMVDAPPLPAIVDQFPEPPASSASSLQEPSTVANIPPEEVTEMPSFSTKSEPELMSSPTKSGSIASSPIKPAPIPEIPLGKDVLMAELKAIKITSIQARNASLEAEITATRAKLEAVTKELTAPAAETVKTHIKLLHDYNDIKDIGQGLVGMIAENRGVRIGELYEEFGVDLKD
ncbi:hypothetical protein G7Y89_g10430 [Cudoniella acicularis]|uniref:Swi5-domain-containing protein n=1 Tax=Cudoniella acicularis TaxID=354080 RepID=A0A8H4W0Y6_9HELO|nr:hypothetical protein G7Y89_g10430 [Cudoniella acicularis]